MLIDVNLNSANKRAFIYKINNKSLKFELLKTENNLKFPTDNLIELLDLLEWKETFMNRVDEP
jgi:hypothetical protein